MKFSLDNIKETLQNKDKIGDWVAKYKRQIAVACILLCLVVVAIANFTGKDEESSAEETKASAAAAITDMPEEEEAAPEETNDLEKDVYADVNGIIQQYYDYMSEGDMEGLSSVVDEISEEEKTRILRSKDLVEGYQNISCHTKKGMNENSYLVFVYYELKFVRIDTPAPGLTPMYVYTNEEGNLTIFNGEVDEELKAYVEEVGQHEDVLALRQEVKEKYEAAKAADEELAKQEERYVRIASEAEEAETAEGEPTEGETAEGEGTEGEAAEAPEEAPQEAEETVTTEEATAQNRETRFTESVRLRAQPSTEAENLGTAYQGEHVTQIESYADGWSKINYNGKECYCKTEFLE